MSKPGTIEQTDVGTGSDADIEKMYQVVIFNDEVNTFDHVVECLVEIFTHSTGMASKLAWEAHNNGKAIAQVEAKTEAVKHKQQLVSYGITAEVEPI